MNEVTRDGFLNGRVTVFQPVKGFRAGTDSVLISASIDAMATGSILEFGCGAGGALLPASIRVPEARFTGLEHDAAMADLAKRGVAENDLSARVSIEAGDAGALDPSWQNQFDIVFSNPPFFETGRIQEPGPGKQAAYLESLPLKDWINAMLFALRHKGTFLMVHRAADLARILSVIERQSGDIIVMPVHSYPGADAKRVVVRARKGLRSGPMRLIEPRYLYQSKGGDRTDWAIGLQRDARGLDWSQS